jgi:Family of unknown function (DUF5343)
MTKNSSNNQPPYVSYGVFTKSIETFANTTVPTGPIDRRVLNEFSGADYGALIPGLRFLGLIDDDRKATTEYRELVNLWTDNSKFKGRMKQLLGDKYKPVIGALNLTHGTSAELEKAFKDYGVSAGQMLTKTIRFFLKAATESGYQISPFLTQRKPRSPNVSPKKNDQTRLRSGLKLSEKEELIINDLQVPDGFERLSLPGIPNSFIQYPTNFTEAHCQVLEAMVGVLRTSVKARTGGKEPKP